MPGGTAGPFLAVAADDVAVDKVDADDDVGADDVCTFPVDAGRVFPTCAGPGTGWGTR